MSFSAIIFDLFGTLVSGYAWQTHEAVVQEMALIIGAPVDEFVYLFEGETREDREIGVFSSIEENITFICNKLSVTTNPHLIKQAALRRYQFTEQALELRVDTMSTLIYLRKHGYKIGLISDCSPDVPPLWLKTPMAQWITEPIFSSNVGVKKPSPKIYELAIQKYDVSPSQCLYVGDGGSHELTGAKQIGMVPVLLRAPREKIAHHMRPDAQSWDGLTISSLWKVKELLRMPATGE